MDDLQGVAALKGIERKLGELVEQLKEFNFYRALRYLGVDEEKALNEELKKIEETSGAQVNIPEVARRLCHYLQRSLSFNEKSGEERREMDRKDWLEANGYLTGDCKRDRAAMEKRLAAEREAAAARVVETTEQANVHTS